jgi:hypothetical protein
MPAVWPSGSTWASTIIVNRESLSSAKTSVRSRRQSRQSIFMDDMDFYNEYGASFRPCFTWRTSLGAAFASWSYPALVRAARVIGFCLDRLAMPWNDSEWKLMAQSVGRVPTGWAIRRAHSTHRSITAV